MANGFAKLIHATLEWLLEAQGWTLSCPLLIASDCAVCSPGQNPRVLILG
jgi:hypothetical protein